MSQATIPLSAPQTVFSGITDQITANIVPILVAMGLVSGLALAILLFNGITGGLVHDENGLQTRNGRRAREERADWMM